MTKKVQTKESDKDKKNVSQKEILEKKTVEYLDGWKRAKADYINLKKEMEVERKKAMFFSTILFLVDFLPILTNLQKASKALEEQQTAKNDNWATGIIHITKQFDEFLKGKGVERVKTKDREFDPEKHEAVDRETSKDKNSGIIIKEVEPGYTLNGSVIIPAKVIVAK